MQYIGICALSMIGTTLEASSDVQPTAAIRFELPAIIALAAGTASAGSPRVSNFWQLTCRPPMPPLLLVSRSEVRRTKRTTGAGKRRDDPDQKRSGSQSASGGSTASASRERERSDHGHCKERSGKERLG